MKQQILASMLTLAVALTACTNGSSEPPAAIQADTLPSPSVQIETLVDEVGGRVDWSPDGTRIAFDRLGEDGFFDVWTMAPDGSDAACLTCDTPGLPLEHVGNPAWHPSGDYLVVQAADDALEAPLAGTDLYGVYTNPGAGFHNNLYLISSNGEQAWQLTDLGRDRGVLHPHFSHDGTKLLWAEMVSSAPRWIGTWTMQLATISLTETGPVLSDIQTLTPGDLQWYEAHGFSPNDEMILFSGMEAGGGEEDFDIYTLDLSSGALQILTDSDLKEWDEHAHFTPDGEHIVWMSSMGIDQRARSTFRVNTDYWIMDRDGNNKRRLTYFNDPDATEHIPGRVVASDFSFNPTGTALVAYVQIDPTTEKPGAVVRIGTGDRVFGN